MRPPGLAVTIVALGALWAALARIGPRGLPPGIVVIGAILGTTSALGALGIVLVHRATGVLNLAQGQLGALGAALAITLVAHDHVPWLVAVPVGVAVAGGAGAATHLVVMRRLRRAPVAVAVIATLGVGALHEASARAVAAVVHHRGHDRFGGPLHVAVTLRPAVLSGDHLLALAVAAAAAAALHLALRRSRWGLAVRAVASNLPRAATIGLPVESVLAITWAVAGILSAVALVLQAPILGLAAPTAVAASGTGLLLRALAAAVIGGMHDVRRTTVAAIALGVVEQIVTWWTGDQTIADVVLALVVIVAVIALPGRRRPNVTARRGTPTWLGGDMPSFTLASLLRGDERARRLDRGAVAGCVAVAVIAPVLVPAPGLHAFSAVWPYAIIGVSMVVVTGWTGHLTLGQLAIAAVGGGVCAVLYDRQHVDVFFALAAAAAVGAVAGAVLGLPAVRGTGLVPAASLAFSVACSEWLVQHRHAPWFVVAELRRPVLWGAVATRGEAAMYYVGLAALSVVFVAVWRAARSSVRRAALAMAQNERAALAVGLDPRRVALRAFALGGAVAGFGGGVLVLHQRGLVAGTFTPAAATTVVAIAAIGGLGSIRGAVVGAIYTQVAYRLLPPTWTQAAVATGILAVVLWSPGGLIALVDRARLLVLRATSRDVPGVDAEKTTTSATASRVGDASESILTVTDLALRIDGIAILQGVTLHVAAGEIVAIVGPNGAGKSALVDCITGAAAVTRGSITFTGEDVTDLPAHLRHRRGMACAPGGRGVFGDLTVAEHLELAARGDDGDVLARFPELRERLAAPAASLSGGEQQLLNLAMATLTRPRLLVLDELSEGLAPAVAERALDMITELGRAGVAVLFVEQAPKLARRVADRGVFIEAGMVRFDGSLDALLETDLVRSLVLRPVRSRPGPEPLPTATSPVLEVRDLTVDFGPRRVLDRVAMAVRPGEVLAVVGPNGAGKSTMFDVISGFLRPTTGTVLLDGRDVTSWTPQQRSRAGLGRSFQDAHLWPSLSVADAVALGAGRGHRDPDAAAADIDDVLDAFGLVNRRADPIGALSAGARRVVEVAVAAASRPAVALLDEPSEGVGHAELEGLADILRGLAGRWASAVVFIEHDLDLVRAVATRRIVLTNGQVALDRRLGATPER